MSTQNFVSYGDAETIFAEVGDALANKADLVSGKVPASQLPSTEQADWNQTDLTTPSFIKNKPTLGTAASRGVTTSATSGSTNLITSGGVYTALSAKLDKADVDTSLSSTSTNPVQNKAVQTALAGIVDGGAKNHLKLSASTQTINGVTFTVNADQTVTVTGTLASGQSRAVFWLAQSVPGDAVGTDRILTGCPAGGGSSTYRIVCEQSVNPYGNIGFDSGSGVVLKASSVPVSFYISVTTHSTLNLTFSPMVCSVSDYAISTAFKPYVPTNAELYAMLQN